VEADVEELYQIRSETGERSDITVLGKVEFKRSSDGFHNLLVERK
jgi:hypothetical protein